MYYILESTSVFLLYRQSVTLSALGFIKWSFIKDGLNRKIYKSRFLEISTIFLYWKMNLMLDHILLSIASMINKNNVQCMWNQSANSFCDAHVRHWTTRIEPVLRFNGISNASYSSIMGVLLLFSTNAEKDFNVSSVEMYKIMLTVFGDGTWKKTGFSSLFFVSTLIGTITGKVLEALLKSSVCSACFQWKAKKCWDNVAYYTTIKDHEEQC